MVPTLLPLLSMLLPRSVVVPRVPRPSREPVLPPVSTVRGVDGNAAVLADRGRRTMNIWFAAWYIGGPAIKIFNVRCYQHNHWNLRLQSNGLCRVSPIPRSWIPPADTIDVG